MYRNQRLVKAVAFSLCIKSKVTSSTVTNYTINKLHLLSGLSATTVKKRLQTLSEYSLVAFSGKNNQHITFCRIQSNNNRRNIKADYVNQQESAKNIEKSLNVMLVVAIQQKKDYVRRAIRLSSEGRTFREIRDAKRACKCIGFSTQFKEYGLSYAGIAKRLGISIATAFSIVKSAVQRRILQKKKRIVQLFYKGAGQFKKPATEFGDFTFISKNNLYKVYANTYIICTQ